MYLQRDAIIRRLVHPNENAKLRANARIEEKRGVSVRQEYEAHRLREPSGPGGYPQACQGTQACSAPIDLKDRAVGAREPQGPIHLRLGRPNKRAAKVRAGSLLVYLALADAGSDS